MAAGRRAGGRARAEKSAPGERPRCPGGHGGRGGPGEPGGLREESVLSSRPDAVRGGRKEGRKTVSLTTRARVDRRRRHHHHRLRLLQPHSDRPPSIITAKREHQIGRKGEQFDRVQSVFVF